jgi:hypothetical protein
MGCVDRSGQKILGDINGYERYSNLCNFRRGVQLNQFSRRVHKGCQTESIFSVVKYAEIHIECTRILLEIS